MVHGFSPWFRHHAHEGSVTRPITQAVRRAGMSRRATSHSFRHSFATHASVDTMIYTLGILVPSIIEAKVKTFQAWDWHIRDEFGEFRKGLNHEVSSSNLFTQLYHKVRLVGGLRQGGIQQLQHGLPFPAWSSKALRTIGNNGVVLEATRRLQSHLGEVFYLAIVPDTAERVAAFFPESQTLPHPTLANEWDVTNYGYLTWSQVRAFCEQAGLTRTVAVFDYNAGQIYRV
jgi:hypothetical protein